MDLSEELKKSRDALAELTAIFEEASKAGLGHATVINIGSESITLAVPNGTVEVGNPGDIALGDNVLTWPTGQICKAFRSVVTGTVVLVNRVDGNYLEVSHGGAEIRVVRAQSLTEVEEGDRVVLDPTNRCAMERISEPEQNYKNDAIETVLWDDIGGQDDAKKELIEAIELPHKHPEIFAFYNKRATKGVLLYGDPGCGKTMMGKAVANSLAETGQQAGFIYVKGPEVLNAYVGASEANVRALFARARAHKAKYGVTAVIFIDEADALLGVRGNDHHSLMEKTIVPTFLAEMDGVEQSDAIVILATNRPDILDPAIVRDGRIDRKVRVTRPNEAEAELIFSLYLKKVPLSETDVATAAKVCVQALFHPDHSLYHAIFDNEVVSIKLSHFISGAMIAGIVDKACSLAIYRDLAAKTRTGVTLSDMMEAVHQTYHQNRDNNHDEVIKNIANGREIKVLKKVK